MKRNYLLFVPLLLLLAVLAAHAQPTGIAGVDQAASTSPLIYDTFDYANGTLINGNNLPSGNSVWVSNNNAVVQNGAMRNVGNTYPGFACTNTIGGTPQPCTYIWGVFQYDLANPGFCSVVLIPDQDGTMQKFLHLEVCADRWVFGVSDGPTYPFNTLLAQDAYQLLTAGVPHRVAMDIDAVGCTVRLYLPDGTTHNVTHPSICDVDPKFVHYQLGIISPGNTAWRAVGVGGPQKADMFAAAGGAASQTDLNKLQQITNKIGGQKNGLTLGSPTLFASFQNNGSQTVNRLLIHAITTDNSTVLPSAALEVDDWELTIQSTGCCSFVSNTKQLNGTNVPGLGVCISTSLISSITGTPGNPYTVYLYAQPNTYGGCANNGYVSSARVNYTVEADGDPYGQLQAQ